MNVLTAALAALIPSLAGFAASERLKNRVLQLSLMIAMLEEMSAMLRYRSVRTDEMIRELFERESLREFGFLTLLKRGLDNGGQLREAWRAAADKAVFLAESDRDILYRLGERLGATDTEGQLSLIGLCREFSDRALLEAREEYRSKGGIFKKTGLLCGAALGIFIL